MQHLGHGADSTAVWVGEDRCSNSGTLRLLSLRHKNQGLLFVELAGKNILSFSCPLLTSLHFSLASYFNVDIQFWFQPQPADSSFEPGLAGGSTGGAGRFLEVFAAIENNF